MHFIKAQWQYRKVLVDKVKQDFYGKYRNSLLGGAWALIEPISMVFIYTFIFSNVIGARLSGDDSRWAYSIYLCSGLLCWEFFSQSANRLPYVFLENANLIKKSVFPKSLLPLVILLSNLLQYCIFLLIFIIFLLIIDAYPGEEIFYLILGMGSLFILTAGFGVLLSIFNVFFRDVARFSSVIVSFGFWGTPIVYSIDMVPVELANLIKMVNPLASLVEFHHAVFLSTLTPDITNLIFPTLVGGFLCTLGWWFFERLEGDIIDEL